MSSEALSTSQVAISIPPPYMDPANSQAKKVFLKTRAESIKLLKPCEHCGAPPKSQIFNVPDENGWSWPAVRPEDSIRQDSRKFFGFVLLIAAIVFFSLMAFKYLP